MSAAKLKEMHESEIQKLRTDGETVSTKLKAELNSIKRERDSTNQKVNWLFVYHLASDVLIM